MKGVKTAEVAQRLVISQADFFRKQNVAIAEVAKVLADMEIELGKNGLKTP